MLFIHVLGCHFRCKLTQRLNVWSSLIIICAGWETFFVYPPVALSLLLQIDTASQCVEYVNNNLCQVGDLCCLSTCWAVTSAAN